MSKIVMAVGGTGGHIYPAIALATKLKEQHPDLEILFMGGKLEQNRYFEKGAFPYHSTRCASLSKNPLKLLKGGIDILRGIAECRQTLREYNPDVIVGFGSYHSFPALAAAAWNQAPFILHESNSVPGKVNRLLSSKAAVTGILFPSAAAKLKGKTQLVDMPLRNGYSLGAVSRKEAAEYFGLDPKKPTILIFGGSQGAQALNKMAAEGLKGPFQVIHIAGSPLHVEQIRTSYQKQGISACVKEFETRMDLAWSASDLAICRSGAVTLAEALEFEVPTLLIPYPHAADDHQFHNALWMANEVKGGMVVPESALNAQLLNEKVNNLLKGDLSTLKERLQAYKTKQARKSFSQLIVEHL